MRSGFIFHHSVVAGVIAVYGSPIRDEEISQTVFVLKRARFLMSVQILLSCPASHVATSQQKFSLRVLSGATCFVWQASTACLYPIVSGFEVWSREHAEVNPPWWCKYQHGGLIMSEATTQLSIQAFNQGKSAQSSAEPE